MKTVSLSGSLRENVGKKDAKKNRKEGRIPCVLYGGKEQVHFTVDEKIFSKLIFTPEAYLIKLNVSDKAFEAVLQDVQYHPVSDRVLHADFLEVLPGKPVTVSLPLIVTGVAQGVVLQGGKLFAKKRRLSVRALKDDIPDHIEVDVTPLNIGQAIKVEDLYTDKYQILDYARDMVVTVKTSRVATPAEIAEEAEAEGKAAETEGGEAAEEHPKE